jgi:putative membrane protein
MYTKRNYSFWKTFNWSKWPFVIGVAYSGVLACLGFFLNIHISLPWEPISVIGIAVAFYLGFKNNSSYDRTWEARKIYGGIVNNSRSFGASLSAFIKGNDADEIRKELVYRHIAWLTALRYQLRLSKPWEHVDSRIKGKYSPTICENYIENLDKELLHYLSSEEIKSYKNKTNVAVQILNKQAIRLQELRDNNYYEEFRQMEFHHLIISFYEDQGKAERIKNFPFPRQYASTAMWLTLVFSALVPLGIYEAFKEINNWMFWVFPLLSGLIIWIYYLMEKIGDYSENPFEGTYNDVPITSISRGIEIDLREMINDTDIPKPMTDENGFLL